MVKICLCLTGRTLARNLETLEKYRRYIDVAELRVDYLHPNERFLIRRFPEQAGLPVILTVRRKIDGGLFENGEGARVHLLSMGLAFAETDTRRNFAYVDLEEDLEVPGLEEAARTSGTRIIRSFHDLSGVTNIAQRLKGLWRIGDEIAKAAAKPQSLEETIKIYEAAYETRGMDKIILGMGRFGINTRILAEHLGSYLTYTSILTDADIPPAAAGQMDPRDLVENFRFREITGRTNIYGLTGFPLKTSYSPRIFNAVFNHEKIDAVYVPFPAQDLGSFLNLAKTIKINGASITIPYKEEILSYLRDSSETVRDTGACNTIKFEAPGWRGINTDTLGFSESLLYFTGRKNFRSLKITVLGAGGAARAVVSEIHRLKGKCLILNRNAVRARDLAMIYGYKWGALDSQALDSMERYSDIIIQTTPVGTFPQVQDDPFDVYHFKGHETVMDLIYNPPVTAFLKRAQAAGCRILNGMDMLIRQAKYQYQYFFNRDFPDQLITRLTEMLRE
ncbi:MAG: type I 3-dehydroquinate dehydratase [Spirochaetaceae bacterium]|jgi:3-dehydroquinate dehydratase/shikimate dehydrogenase|nr:type I 3-dehydroquinate dehydratase [Spirochaetaceae bacterium]